jgi:putative DNA primase/helicase
VTGRWEGLTEVHQAVLESAAVSPEAAAGRVVSATSVPDGYPGWWRHRLPGMLYRWSDGVRTEYQLAADDRETYADSKYVFRDKPDPLLNRVRDPAPGEPLLLVEGTKQTLCAASLAPSETGVWGMAGCWGWSRIDLTCADGLAVVVVLDGDLSTNRGVYEAAAGLREALTVGGAASVSFVALPVTGTDGLDDLMGRTDPARRSAVLARLVEAAGDLPVKAPRRPAAEPGAYIDPSAGGLQAETTARAVMSAQPACLDAENRVLLYSHGVYRSDPVALRAAVGALLREQYRPGHLAAVEGRLSGLLWTDGLRLPERPDRPVANLANGLLDLTTGDLSPHTPDHRSAVQLPVSWEPEAVCPTYDRWLMDVIGGQADELEEVAGSMLDPSRPPQRAMFLFGPSRSGKSTFLRLLAAVAGAANTSAVTLHQLSEDRFAAAAVAGKTLNVAADLSAGHVEDLAVFKLLTGADLVHANRKYGGQFTFTNSALFAFSANEVPSVNESSRAYSERVRPFEFGRSFAGKEDPGLEARMLAELPGILRRWVAAWQRARTDPTPPDERVGAAFEGASDRVRQWVAEEMEVIPLTGSATVPGALTPTELARSFARWAEDGGGPPIGRNKLVSRLLSIRGVREVRTPKPAAARALSLRKADSSATCRDAESRLAALLDPGQDVTHSDGTNRTSTGSDDESLSVGKAAVLTAPPSETAAPGSEHENLSRVADLAVLPLPKANQESRRGTSVTLSKGSVKNGYGLGWPKTAASAITAADPSAASRTRLMGHLSLLLPDLSPAVCDRCGGPETSDGVLLGCKACFPGDWDA